MRVLMVHHGAEMYGSDRIFLELVRAVSTVADVSVVLDSKGPLRAELEQYAGSVRIIRLGVLRKISLTPLGLLSTGIQMAGAIPRLIWLVVRKDIEIVYTNTVIVVSAAVASRLTRRRHIWHIHEILGDSLAERLLAALVSSMSDCVVCVSEAVEKRLVSMSPGVVSKTRVVHNAVSADRLTSGADVRQARLRLGLSDSAFVVLLAGRINSRKGHEPLLDAIACLEHDVRERTTLLFAGDCFEGYAHIEEHLRTRAADLGLGESVRFLGYRSDMATLMAACDVVVVPSELPEAFGLVALEGMLARRPVVATNAGALPEIIVDGTTGFLIPAGSSQLLTASLAKLARDAALAQALGEAGHRRAVTYFSRERFASSVARLLGTSSTSIHD